MKCGTNGQEKTSSSESRLTDDYNGVVGLMTKPESTTEARRHEEPQVNFSIATRFILVLVKITVTLRHDLVGWAERTARKMRISRNRLFSTAITEFLERRRTRKITERLNQVYAKESSRIASILHSVQIRSLGKDRW